MTSSTEPSAGLGNLDPVIHAPKRLAVMAILASTTSTEFSYFKDKLAISDSDLSKQMSALEAAGYVSSHKSGRGRGSTTTFKITRAGTKAFNAHRAALRAMLGD